MDNQNFEQQEAFIYRQGMTVELQEQLGKIYIIEEYDEMMVPPIWLEDYPKPCYPEQLELKSNPFMALPAETFEAA